MGRGRRLLSTQIGHQLLAQWRPNQVYLRFIMHSTYIALHSYTMFSLFFVSIFGLCVLSWVQVIVFVLQCNFVFVMKVVCDYRFKLMDLTKIQLQLQTQIHKYTRNKYNRVEHICCDHISKLVAVTSRSQVHPAITDPH